MEEMISEIKKILFDNFNLHISNVKKVTSGVGGYTYIITSSEGNFIYKISSLDEMNHPDLEAELCDYLFKSGIPVAEFIKNKDASFHVKQNDKLLGHLYRFVEGKVYKMNAAPEWYMEQTPILLANIHNKLKSYKELPEGIGSNFFKFMTPDSSKKSFVDSLEKVKKSGESELVNDIEFRIKFLEKIKNWKFDMSKLTIRNTHGDFTINQIVCGKDKVNAVIDWTCACRHPVIWEITRSFYYAEPSCSEGKLDKNKFKEYVDRYCSVAQLNEYDKENILKLYYYQIAVCDYYSQYLGAEEDKKEEYLIQARFATKVLRNSGI